MATRGARFVSGKEMRRLRDEMRQQERERNMAKRPDLIEFVVEGAGSFPIDMLRYDTCYPADSRDVEAMDNAGEKRRITMRHRVLKGENPQSCPERGRWSSFGWKVVGELRWRNID